MHHALSELVIYLEEARTDAARGTSVRGGIPGSSIHHEDGTAWNRLDCSLDQIEDPNVEIFPDLEGHKQSQDVLLAFQWANGCEYKHRKDKACCRYHPINGNNVVIENGEGYVGAYIGTTIQHQGKERGYNEESWQQSCSDVRNMKWAQYINLPRDDRWTSKYSKQSILGRSPSLRRPTVILFGYIRYIYYNHQDPILGLTCSSSSSNTVQGSVS